MTPTYSLKARIFNGSTTLAVTMPNLLHAANDQRINEHSDSDADVAQKKLDQSCTGPPKRNRTIVTDDDDDHCAEPQPPEQSTPLQPKSDSDDNFGVILLSEQQRSQLASKQRRSPRVAHGNTQRSTRRAPQRACRRKTSEPTVSTPTEKFVYTTLVLKC